MSTLFMSHRLRPFPGLITRDRTAATGDRLTRMLEILTHVQAAGFDEVQIDKFADVEDFWEDAIRIATLRIAAIETGLIVERRAGGPNWSRMDLARRTGPLSHSEQGGPHSADSFEAILAGLPQVTTGRTFASCTHDSEIANPPVDHLVPHLLALQAAGHTAAVVKIAGHKQGVARIELDADPHIIERHLHKAFDWTMVRLDGLVGAFLVSPWIDMTCEYRIFVVDGLAVTGAACIEEYTPLDHSGSDAFDPAIRVHRGNQVAAISDSPVIKDPHRVQKHLAAAGPVIEHLASIGFRTYVVDIAYVPDLGRSVVIEFNSIPNAGLYACDAQALAHALVRTDHKGYYDYAPRPVL